ncbi:hypothetical protein TNCV_126711 [Trichonephila clavipes]|nr:hypothetical protein TNCV_126711 [Trichonephila clavipes]
MNKIRNTTARLYCHIVLSEEISVVDDDNVCAVPIMADKDILEFFQSSKNIIDADSKDGNEMNNAAPLFSHHPKWETSRKCALWAGGIIDQYFFKNDEGHNVTVNGDRYRAMITNFFIPELNNHDVQEMWFQQDGATCHTARATIDLLKDTFGDRLISRFGTCELASKIL